MNKKGALFHLKIGNVAKYVPILVVPEAKSNL